LGEIAALATSFCWSFTSIQFTLAGQRIGSGVVNGTFCKQGNSQYIMNLEKIFRGECGGFQFQGLCQIHLGCAIQK
jgi:hypothetical protein